MQIKASSPKHYITQLPEEHKATVLRFARSIVRQEDTRNRGSSFNAKDFKLEDYLDLMKEQNAKVEIS